MKTKILALALAAFAPFAVMADVSYSYLDVNYQFSGSFEPGTGGSTDLDGFGFKVDYAMNDNWFFQFDWASFSADPTGSLDDYALTIGWHGEMFFVRGGYEALDDGTFSEGGFVVDFGLRTMMADSFELNAHVGMSDLGDSGSTTNYGVGAVYMFNDNMGVSFNYDLRSFSDIGGVAGPGGEGDFDTMGLGFRYNFN